MVRRTLPAASGTVEPVPTIPTALPEDRDACYPCRGTGKVISGLGGSPHEIPCPWCGGSGRWRPAKPAGGEESADERATAA